MIIVNPVVISPAMIVSSSAAVSTRTAWNSGTAYVSGNEVYYNYKDWIAVAASTNVTPGTNDTKWIEIAASNRYAMFDGVINNVTTATSPLDVTVDPGSVVNAVSLFQVTANTVQVQVIDPVEGIVYDQTEDMQDTSIVIDWYSYFFEPIVQKSDVSFINLPAYGSANIRIVADAGTGNNAIIGEAIIGRQRQLGVTNFNTSVSIQDYSRKERDQFGNVIVVERQFAKLADYDVTVETSLVNVVQNTLANIRTTPTVFIGDANRPETIVYGFYRNFNIVLSTPSISECTIEVEGLT